MCYDISLHSDIELTREVFPKVKDQRIRLDGGKDREHVLSFGFPEFPIISRQGSELILSDMEWSVDPTYEKDPVMLTRSANEVMSNIHNDGEFRHRMPLFLIPELEEFWPSEHFTDGDMQAVFDYQLPSELLGYHPLFSVRGKKPQPDGKHKYDPWHYENLLPPGNHEPLLSQTSLF